MVSLAPMRSVESFKARKALATVPMSTLGIVWNRVKGHPLSRVGPGLITGVADDDHRKPADCNSWVHRRDRARRDADVRPRLAHQ